MNEKTLSCVGIIFGFLSFKAQAAYTCSQKGLFTDPDSNDCASFYSCNSNLDAQLQQCTGGTYFSPELQGCFSFYDCATKSSPYSADPCRGFEYENIPDKSSSDCSQFLYCQTSQTYNNGEYMQYSQVTATKCSEGTTYNMRRSSCSSESKCTHYECTTQGQFVDPNGNDCSTFIRCYKYTNRENPATTMWVPDLQTCPANTKFNPFLQKCDSFYKCNNVDKHRGKDPCKKYNPDQPFVENPYDTSGKSYLNCVYRDANYEDRGMILKETCPKNTLFSPLVGKCYNNYDPNEMCSKDACASGPGKYPNYKSGNCGSFIFCQNDRNEYGYPPQQIYEPTYEIHYCPEGTNFNPKTRSCSKQYVCPTISTNYCYVPIATTTPGPTTTTYSPYPYTWD